MERKPADRRSTGSDIIKRERKEQAMLRLILGQVLAAYLTKSAASGRYSRLVSAGLALFATRMGGAGKLMGIWGMIAALSGRGRR